MLDLFRQWKNPGTLNLLAGVSMIAAGVAAVAAPHTWAHRIALGVIGVCGALGIKSPGTPPKPPAEGGINTAEDAAAEMNR